MGLVEIQPEKPEQIDAFTPSQTKDLMAVMDTINTMHCPIISASQGLNQNWAMQGNMKSPNYATKVSDIPNVKIL